MSMGQAEKCRLSRWVMNYTLGWGISKISLQKLFDQIFSNYPLLKSVYARNDNGPQFAANLIRQYFDRTEGVV